MNKILLIITTFLFSSMAIAGKTIFDADYDLYWSSTKIGKVERKLVNNDKIYTFISNAKPKGFAKMLTKGVYEKSSFRVKNNLIEPIEYYFEQRGKDSRTIEHKYSWSNRTLQTIRPERIKVKNLKKNTMDLLNFQYFIMRGLATGQTDFAMTLYKKPHEPDNYQLKVAGKEKVKVAAGDYDTIKLARIGGRNSFYLWCAPRLNYLPVKIMLIDRKGKQFTMTLRKVRSW